jgi:hypothetical protein
MSYTWFLIFSCSIFIAAILGWVRFTKIAPAFHPFIFCLFLGAVNEIISMILAHAGHSTIINNNIYVLCESLLLVVQLGRWDAWGRLHTMEARLLALLAITWLAENIFLLHLNGISSFFRVFYSSAIVLLSINVLNNLIVSEKGQLLKHPVFLSCIGFVTYFSYKIIVEAFWFYGLSRSNSFRENVYSIMVWINLIVNLIYACAVLWMPAKQRFTIQY